MCAYVCEKWFPKEKTGRRHDGFYMNDLLKKQIDVLIKNAPRDWDFTIIIGGSGEMRVGKSLLAMQVACYWSYQISELYNIKVPFNIKENFAMAGNEVMEKGTALGEKYKCAALINDEAADDLESAKVLRAATQAIKDFLRKAAQYNMLSIIVQSEFFELPKGIALSRSIYYIDVRYDISEEGLFERGHFKFYSKRTKKRLYLKGKKELDYNAVPRDFEGTFPHFYPVDEQEYRAAKADSLKKWKRATAAEIRWREWFRGALKLIYHELGLTHREIADQMNEIGKVRIGKSTIGALLKGEKYAGEEEEDD